MYRVYACITQQHDLFQVGLAAVLCLFAAFAALSIVNRAAHYTGWLRCLWLAAGAAVSAVGIWSTHFVAMLAFDTGLPTGFDLHLTALSLVIALALTGVGFAVPVYARQRAAPLFGGILFGIGISAMHFVGMKGLLVPAFVLWDPVLVAAAWLLGCSLAMIAIAVAHGVASIGGRIAAALLLTLAICSMHFTGMAAVTLTPSPLVPMPDAYLTSERLGIDILLAALVILTISTSAALVDQHLVSLKAREAERLHSLVNATFEGIGICVAGRLVEVNDALTDLLKLPAEDLRDRPFETFIAPEQRAIFTHKLNAERDGAMEIPVMPASGAPIFVNLLIKSINYCDLPAKVIAVRDITERRAARQKLEEYRDHLELLVEERTTELREQAERLTEALDEERRLAGLQRQFVSMVSHEFRTPLAIIDGHAQRILRRFAASVPDRAREGLSKIRTSVTRLTELMESVLAAARLEDGRIEFKPGPCSLADIIAEIARNYGELYPDHDIKLDLDQAPPEIIGDAKLLRQVFSNLISNAVKYSPQGGSVWVDGWTEEAGDVVVTVRDEGVGIPLAEQQKLFDRFFRASTSTGIAGTGIGLHLALHLVRMHDGSIELESEEGRGTTFRVLLPVREAPVAAGDPERPDLAAFEMPADPPEVQENAA